MVNKKRISESDRITLIAVILAIFFGILSKVPITNDPNVIFALPLQSIANFGFNFAIIWFLAYCVGVGVSWYYKNPIDTPKSKKALSLLYDAGMVITASILALVLIIYLGFLLDKFLQTGFLSYVFLIISVIIVTIMNYRVITNYLIIGDVDMSKIKNWLVKKFSWKRIFTAVTFSAVVGVTYWATTVYERAFNTEEPWWMAIGAFFLVAGMLLIVGSNLLDAMSRE